MTVTGTTAVLMEDQGAHCTVCERRNEWGGLCSRLCAKALHIASEEDSREPYERGVAVEAWRAKLANPYLKADHRPLVALVVLLLDRWALRREIARIEYEAGE